MSFRNPFGVDLTTMILGAGISLRLSVGDDLRSGDHGLDRPRLLGAIRGVFVIVATLLGIVLVVSGLR